MDFRGSAFTDCVFKGKLEDVTFERHTFGLEHLPPNSMRGVDFSEAEFHDVDFRGLDLAEVRWPSDRDISSCATTSGRSCA